MFPLFQIDYAIIVIAILGMLVFIELVMIVNSLRYTRQLLRIKDKHEAELRRAHEKLKSVDRLKTEFLNMAAHELKTPLVPMVGYLQLIDKNKLDPEDRENLEIAIRNTKRLQLLVGDILDIAKLESKVMKFNMQDIQLTNIIRDTVANAMAFAKEKKIYIKTNVPKELPIVYGDPNRIAQVLTNLLNNAIKFTDRGGVTVNARRDGNFVRVEVVDTGIGMAKKDIPKLFKKFSQLDSSGSRKYGGTGLGLAISKEIIKAHKGKIWASSPGPGKGSTFTFILPIKPK
ncbi:MAG: HAMP domain-containing sensor histidine kinase [Candidatus Hadarchaeales archaeon]